MGEREAFPLHPVDARGGGVKDQVHQMIVKQVDLIHIQDAAVGLGKEARRTDNLSFLERFGENLYPRRPRSSVPLSGKVTRGTRFFPADEGRLMLITPATAGIPR